MDQRRPHDYANKYIITNLDPSQSYYVRVMAKNKE
jgi:hypothetical protein